MPSQKKRTRKPLAERIATLKSGERIALADERERTAALQVAKTLRAAKLISFRFHTHREPDGSYLGVAI